MLAPNALSKVEALLIQKGSAKKPGPWAEISLEFVLLAAGGASPVAHGWAQQPELARLRFLRSLTRGSRASGSLFHSLCSAPVEPWEPASTHSYWVVPPSHRCAASLPGLVVSTTCQQLPTLPTSLCLGPGPAAQRCCCMW